MARRRAAPDPARDPRRTGAPRRLRPARSTPARGSRKATPGSTTYDEASETPLDPEWEGGAWYGPSSQTYWTINPREYADPRKHGPEYLARARRAAQQEAGTAGPEGGGPADGAASAETGAPGWGFGGGSTTTDGDGGWGTHGWAYEEAPDAADPGTMNRAGGAGGAGRAPA